MRDIVVGDYHPKVSTNRISNSVELFLKENNKSTQYTAAENRYEILIISRL